MNEFHSRREMDVKRAVVSAHPGSSQRQHRSEPLAARLDQMGGHLGDARRMVRGHARTDQDVDPAHVVCKPGGQPVMRFCGCVVQAHLRPSRCNLP